MKRLLLSIVFTVPVAAQGWTQNVPVSSSSVFENLAGFPYPGGPGQFAASCPIQRVSGVHHFRDDMDTFNPNDDRDYFFAGRSDGFMIISADPEFTGGPTTMRMPFNNRYKFVEDLHWGYLGPRPVGSTRIENLNPQRYLDLNGWDNILNRFVGAMAYCLFQVVDWNSNHTTNRELVVQSNENHITAYSINTNFDGIWVVPMHRDAFGDLEAIPGADYWWDAGGLVGKCHMIYIDRGRNLLFLVNDTTGAGMAIRINSDGTLDPAPAIDYVVESGHDHGGTPHHGLPAHDFMPIGDKAYLTIFGTDVLPGTQTPAGRTEVFDLNANPPVHIDTIWTTWTTSIHSIYFDGDQMWMVQEDTNFTPNTRRNLQSVNWPSSNPQEVAVVNYVNPNGISPQIQATVHHLRGIGKSGIVASYNDGISLVDLTADQSQPGPMQSLGTFDVSSREQTPIGANVVQTIVDIFDGAWDVAVESEWGLIFTAAGEEGAMIIKANEGWMNRWGPATPLPTGQYPVLVSANGPPKVNQPVVLKDATEYPMPMTKFVAFTPWEPSNASNDFSIRLGGTDVRVVLDPNPFIYSAFEVNGEIHLPPIPPGFDVFIQVFANVNGTGTWTSSRGHWFRPVQ